MQILLNNGRDKVKTTQTTYPKSLVAVIDSFYDNFLNASNDEN